METAWLEDGRGNINGWSVYDDNVKYEIIKLPIRNSIKLRLARMAFLDQIAHINSDIKASSAKVLFEILDSISTYLTEGEQHWLYCRISRFLRAIDKIEFKRTEYLNNRLLRNIVTSEYANARFVFIDNFVYYLHGFNYSQFNITFGRMRADLALSLSYRLARDRLIHAINEVLGMFK